MELREVDRHFGSGRKWVWVAGPQYLLEEGTDELRPWFEPVASPEDIDWESGDRWGWTCHKDTKAGDIAVIYESAGKAGSWERLGTKQMRAVLLVTDDAVSLDEEYQSGESEFDGYGCACTPVARLHPGLSISAMKADERFSSFGALRAGFVRRASEMPDDFWQGLLTRQEAAGVAPPVRTRRRRPRPVQMKQTEHELEIWLIDHLDALKDAGLDLQLIERQRYLPEHGGAVDILAHERGDRAKLVVIELKATTARRDAVAQLLGYSNWLRHNYRPLKSIRRVLIGPDQHPQLQYVLDEIDVEVEWLAWGDDVRIPSRLEVEIAKLREAAL